MLSASLNKTSLSLSLSLSLSQNYRHVLNAYKVYNEYKRGYYISVKQLVCVVNCRNKDGYSNDFGESPGLSVIDY